MKKIIGTVLVMITGGIALIFLGYALFGFLSWISNDPFDWIDIKPVESIESDDTLRCREEGGYPQVSGWDNRLLECKFPR